MDQSNSHELQSLPRSEPHPPGSDDDLQTIISQQREDVRRASSRKRAYVLIGCSILQLPMWGFAITYGIFQEYYLNQFNFKGNANLLGVVGTTSNGVMYLSMPILFGLFTRQYSRYRRAASFIGVVLACIGFLLSSFSTATWHLVATQGIIVALGCSLIYSPTTLSLSEHFSTNNRAVAYGVTLSAKNITGSACPFLLQFLLDNYGFPTTMRIWTILVAVTGLASVYLMPIHPPGTSPTSLRSYRSRRIAWNFLGHRTFWVYSIAILLQSSGYGLPQTYLNTYAHEVSSLSTSSSTLLITLFNAPGILSCTLFGYLCDNRRHPLSATTVALFSALTSGLSAFLLWGLSNTSSSSHSTLALLILFAIIYGAFAGGYSSTWGGMIKEMEKEAAERNEPIDTGMVYGLFNGARGIGYVGGGLVGVQLLKIGGDHSIPSGGKLAYGTSYGPLIIYTGLATAMGGWSIMFKMSKLLRRI